MARCNCNSACNCVIHAGGGIAVSGLGSAISPYLIAASGGADVHDGVGAGSTFLLLSANSPSATGDNSTAIGRNALAAADDSIIIGRDAISDPTAGDSVAIGLDATTNSLHSVAIARGTIATGQSSIAIGHSAQTNGTSAIAIGDAAQATFNNSVALGNNVSTTNTAQVNIGTKRAFIGGPNSAPPDADLVNSQISFYLDEGTNNLKVKVKYAAGTVKIGTLAVV